MATYIVRGVYSQLENGICPAFRAAIAGFVLFPGVFINGYGDIIFVILIIIGTKSCGRFDYQNVHLYLLANAWHNCDWLTQCRHL